MIVLFKILFAFVIAYLAYSRAKKSGMWDWKMFLQVIGSIFVFVGVFVVPMVYTNFAFTHPGMFFGVFGVGLALYMWWIVRFSKRMMTELRRRQELGPGLE